MASGGHLESYLNKDVSVITTREIRYQGELASFDKENRTITLRKVHNMGTEDRVSAMRLFPSSKVFDFIVFHAEHLKDFRLMPRDAEDPAIVSCVGERPHRASQGVMNMLERPASPGQQNRHGRVRNIDIQQMLRAPMNRGRQPPPGRHGRQNYNHHDDRNKRNRHVSFNDARLENVRGSRERASSFTHVPHIPRSMVLRFANAKKRDSQPKSRKGSRSIPGQPLASKIAKLEFNDDFDFEKALEDFESLALNDKNPDSKEGGGVDAESGDAKVDYYDKGKSFFDNLTTTTAEAPKRTRKDELEANKVTFGVSHIRREKWRRSSMRHQSDRRRTATVA